MVHTINFKHAVLALGLSVTFAACGGDDTSTGTNFHYNPDIQNDLKSLGCTVTGCHGASGGTTNLKIDVTAGMEQANYNVLTTNKYISGMDPLSPLIKVPSTGVALSGAGHQKTLTGTKLTNWQAWAQSGFPF